MRSCLQQPPLLSEDQSGTANIMCIAAQRSDVCSGTPLHSVDDLLADTPQWNLSLGKENNPGPQKKKRKSKHCHSPPPIHRRILLAVQRPNVSAPSLTQCRLATLMVQPRAVWVIFLTICQFLLVPWWTIFRVCANVALRRL